MEKELNREEINCLDKVEILPGRQVGNSNRQINYAIDMLYRGYKVKVIDHTNIDGSCKSKDAKQKQNRNLFNRILQRLDDINHYDFAHGVGLKTSRRNLTIYFENVPGKFVDPIKKATFKLVETKETPKIGDLCFSPRYGKTLLRFGDFENSYPDECKKVNIVIISLSNETIGDTTKFMLLEEWSDRILTMRRPGTIAQTLFIEHPYNNADEIELYRTDCKKVLAINSQISPKDIKKAIDCYNIHHKFNDIGVNFDYSRNWPKLKDGFIDIVLEFTELGCCLEVDVNKTFETDIRTCTNHI